MVLMVLVWLWVRVLFRRGGVGGVLQSLGARLPRAGDLEERQLVNLVEEMSIAAGIKPPQVLLIDTSTANAAAVGTEPADARILVTRGLLATLDREQTQAVIGHLIASICNGDLRIALRLLAVFQTFGLLNVLLAGASDRKARSSLWQAIKGVFWARDRSQVDRVADLLAQGEGTDSGAGSTKSGCLTTIIAPFALGAATAQFLSYIGASMVFGPFLAALWRARRYLADATAVQLTRNPSALANALLELSRGSDQLKAPPSASLLFVLWQGSEKLVAVGSFHPGVGKRIRRLQAEGARLTVRERPWDAAAVAARHEPPGRRFVGRLIMIPLMIFIYTLLAVGVVAMLAGAILMMGVTFFFVTLAIFAIHAVFTYGPSFLHWLATEGPQLLKAIGEMIALLVRHLKK
jgi:Zn-dependent protease with chaperone function